MNDPKGLPTYAASRRRFLRDTTFVSLGIVAAACAPAGTAGPSGGTKAKKGGEFHAAWPFDIPPKGEWNAYGANAILGGSYLVEIAYQNLAIYRWADKKWDYLLAESHKSAPDSFEVKLRKGVKWDDGKDVTSKDAAATFWLARAGSAIWNRRRSRDARRADPLQLKKSWRSSSATSCAPGSGPRRSTAPSPIGRRTCSSPARPRPTTP